MSPSLPDGDPVPEDGALPAGAGMGTVPRDFGVYVHVPFCATRCGYCDFNTYTLPELASGPGLDGAQSAAATSERPGGEPRATGGAMAHYVDAAIAEIALARRVMDDAGLPPRRVATVFFGGGTPTLLPVSHLAQLLDHVRETWGIADGAEITTEANPDSVDRAAIDALAKAGFTRVSFGMQSAIPHVLATLERTHSPGQVARAMGWAREARLETSLDLIYGTPGESIADWRASLQAAIELAPDHISAYALTIEPGTRMGAQLARGQIANIDPDDQAAKYELAETLLSAAGYEWYEISNWARPGFECRHNLGYWTSQDWWGIGPGAHSYLGGKRPVRWWNVKHPRPYAAALAAGRSPAAGRELPDDDARLLEDVMLRVRLRQGLAIDTLAPAARAAIGPLIAEGLLDGRFALPAGGGRAVPTVRGRLLSDTVVRRLLP